MTVKTKPVINFNTTQSHLEALNRRLVDLLGDDYAIDFNKPEDFTHNGETFRRFKVRCIYHTHNEAHYDHDPSGWVAVSLTDGGLISGCWVCDRRWVIYTEGVGWQPAPTLLTLSRRDQHLLKVLVALGCEEVKEVNGREQIAVAFPVTYSDGTEGFHFRVALEGKGKWRHMEGRKASEAVFCLHKQGIQAGIQKLRFVIVTESPLDAAVLNAAGYPAIAVLGKGNAGALACDLHKQALLSLLDDDGTVYVWKEPDAKDFPQKVANALQRPVKVISPPEGLEKDAYRIWLNCRKDWEALKSVIRDLLDSATEIAPQPVPASEFASHDTIVKVAFPPEIKKRVTDIPPLECEWLVEEYIPLGAVTLLAGAGGHGKTSLLCDLAAAIIKGSKWLNKFEVSQGAVILIVTEDPVGIREKLFSYGVNGENDPLLIYDLTEWEGYEAKKAAQALPAILQDAKETFGDIPIRLIGLDCLRGFGFDEKQASRRKGDSLPTVREIYDQLDKFARQEGAAVIVTHHLRKLENDDLKTLYPKRKKGKEVAPDIDTYLLRNLIAGTADIVNAARQALVVIGDKEAGTGIIVPVKSNRSVVLGAPIRYDFFSEAPTFLEFIDEEETALENAMAFLRRVLSKGEILSSELEALAKKEGISNRTYWRARKRLGVHAKKVFVDGKLVWIAYLPNQTNQANQPDQQPNPLPNSDLQGSPPDEPAGNGCLPTNLVDNPNFGSLGSVGEKPKQNLEFCSLPTEKAFGSVGSVGSEPARIEDCQDCQTQNHWQTTLADCKSPINTGISEQDCQDCQTSGNVEAQPEGDLQGDPLVTAEVWDYDKVFGDLPEDDESPTDQPELPDNEPADDPQDKPSAQAQTEVSPPELPVNEPEPAPSAIRRVESDCVIVATADWVESDGGVVVTSDDIPPETPTEPEGSPPESPANPPESTATPPTAPSQLGIYAHKFKRMTERQPDESIRLEWQGKTETVAPDDLAGWQPIETIPDIDLPNIESVKIPPVVVLDLETDGLDPKRGRILAAGLALYVEGKEVEAQIFHNEGDEAALLAQVFDWLRETCNNLGEIILTGYNMFDFDLTYLIVRARKLKVDCPFRFIVDENGKIVRWKVAATEGTLKREPLDYNAIVAKDLPIRLVDTQHLVCRWDKIAKELRNYDLKSVAAHFKVNQPNRPILSPAQILHAFQHDPATFEAYLLADLRETYALFAKLFPPYFGVSALTGLRIDQVATRSPAWVLQRILEQHYSDNYKPQADEKEDYEGGLVVSRKGLWSPCMKIDIASLYPTIMLSYRIHSRKDYKQVALRWLKTLTKQRLELKAKAKAGDENAQIIQEAMKVVINTFYGFYGTPGYPFNDMTAAAKVTAIGRKVLTCMIAAIEDAGGIVVEADTDGIIVCYRNAEPEQILQAVTAAIPPVFKVELEWQEAVVFVSDDKNYIVLDRNGDLIAVKGSKWRGRDKEAYLTQAIPTFVRIWATQGNEAALAFAVQTLNEIRSGQGWHWVVRTHRVGKGDKYLIDAGFKVGEIATYAYKDKKRKAVAKDETEGYDCVFYAKEFSDLVKEVIETIDPALVDRWREIVGQQARPLIFAADPLQP